MYDNL